MTFPEDLQRAFSLSCHVKSDSTVLVSLPSPPVSGRQWRDSELSLNDVEFAVALLVTFLVLTVTAVGIMLTLELLALFVVGLRFSSLSSVSSRVVMGILVCVPSVPIGMTERSHVLLSLESTVRTSRCGSSISESSELHSV